MEVERGKTSRFATVLMIRELWEIMLVQDRLILNFSLHPSSRIGIREENDVLTMMTLKKGDRERSRQKLSHYLFPGSKAEVSHIIG